MHRVSSYRCRPLLFLGPVGGGDPFAKIGLDQAAAHLKQVRDQCGFVPGIGFGIRDAIHHDTEQLGDRIADGIPG